MKMKKRKKILIADDNDNIRKFFQKLLDRYGYEALPAKNGFEALDLIQSDNPDLIILDVVMPDCGGIEVMTEMKNRGVNTPVVVITGYNNMDTAITSLRYGAMEYLVKPVSADKVLMILEKYFSDSDLPSRLAADKPDEMSIAPLKIIGKSPRMQAVMEEIEIFIVDHRSKNVMIFGETGTGKRTIAKQIHYLLRLPKNQFYSVDFSKLSDEAVEKRLFGQEIYKSDRKEVLESVFESAGEGTVFLEHIDLASPAIQEKLFLRLSEKKYTRWNGTEKFDIRAGIMASASEFSASEVAKGCFSEGLYQLLSEYIITIPPLRERLEDIPNLAEYFLKIAASKRNMEVRQFPPETLEFLSEYEWSGNAGELKDLINEALDLAAGAPLLPKHFNIESKPAKSLDDSILNNPLKTARKLVTESFEKQFVQYHLKASGGNVTKAADASAVSRQIFHKMMKRYGLKAENYRKV